MTTLGLNLARDEREEAMGAEIAALEGRFRASGQIGDLVRLRDGRVRLGLTDLEGGMRPTRSKEARSTPADFLPELDMASATPQEAAETLNQSGVVHLRNAFPPRRALEFRKLYNHACAAGQELMALEADGLPDLRHTDEKEMYQRLGAKTGVPSSLAQGYALETGVVKTFMSPRIALTLCDFLTGIGFRSLLRLAVRDDLRLRFDGCVIGPAKSGDAVPKLTRGVLLWIPLCDCGEGTDRPGLEISTQKLSSTAALRPFTPAGDVILSRNHSEPMAYTSNLTQDTLAMQLHVLARSEIVPEDIPVFW